MNYFLNHVQTWEELWRWGHHARREILRKDWHAKKCLVGRQFLNGEQGRGEPLLQAQGNRCMDLVCLGKQDTPLAKTLRSGVGQWWDLGCMPMHI